MSKKIIIFMSILGLLFWSKVEFVKATDKYIVSVNPVRISKYNPNPLLSIKTQYKYLYQNQIPATWLVTYDILKNNDMTNFFKLIDSKHEIGVFLEITNQSANEIGIKYHDTGSWHFANAVLLSGYTTDERRKYIDAVFSLFKENFGYYPKVIGSWWTDAYSLNYIEEKYNISANLICSDQYSTDNYQLWGQPWMYPYIPSKKHPGIIARNESDKLDIVNIQWAYRDPLYGYDSSLYSTQDYLVVDKVLDISYFKDLIRTYLDKSNFILPEVTVGLESDMPPDNYRQEYPKWINILKELRQEGVKIVTMSDYAKTFIEVSKRTNQAYKIEAGNLLGGNKRPVWYQSLFYRLFYIISEDGSIEIKDLKIYPKGYKDPYFVTPNSNITLNINLPSAIDSKQNNESWLLGKNSEINLNERMIIIKADKIRIPESIKRFFEIKQKNNVAILTIRESLEFDNQIYSDYSSETIHFLQGKKNILSLINPKNWTKIYKKNYLIPSNEMDVMSYLKYLPSGKVLVYDNECLQCEYYTEFKHPAFENRRNYVKKYSGKMITEDKQLFETKNREEVKKRLKLLRVKYLYLVKNGPYIEKLQFSPGDYPVKLLYANANAEIWEVIE